MECWKVIIILALFEFLSKFPNLLPLPHYLPHLTSGYSRLMRKKTDLLARQKEERSLITYDKPSPFSLKAS